MKVRDCISGVFMFFAVTAFVSASVLTVTLGDKDGLGFGIAPGGTYTVPFDNRTASDPTFTDFGTFGETNAWFTFTYGAIATTINSASMQFGVGGLEDARNDSGQPDFNDRLFLDSVEIAGAFDSDYTGITTYGIVNLSIPAALFGQLSDGTAAFFFDGYPLGTSTTIRAGDQVSFDYVTLSIDFEDAPAVPAPSSMVLLGVGALLVAGFKRRFSACRP